MSAEVVGRDDVRVPQPAHRQRLLLEAGGAKVLKLNAGGDANASQQIAQVQDLIQRKVAAIAERVPASVVADAEHTVRQLVEIANADPRRGIGHEKVLTRITVDEAAVALVKKQG